MKPEHTSLKKTPKNFQKTKVQFERDVLRYFYKKDQKDVDIQGEFYFLLKEMQAFIENHVIQQEQTLVDNFDLLKKPIYLNDYKKKIFYDEEADWLYIDEMTQEDFRKMVNERKAKWKEF